MGENRAARRPPVSVEDARPGWCGGWDISAVELAGQVAAKDTDAPLIAFVHHVDVDHLRGPYRAPSPRAAAGVGGEAGRPTGSAWRRSLRDLRRVQRQLRNSGLPQALESAEPAGGLEPPTPSLQGKGERSLWFVLVCKRRESPVFTGDSFAGIP